MAISCQDEKSFLKKTKYDDSSKCSILVDTVSIEIDSSALPFYSNYSTYEFDNKTFIIGYNRHSHSLQCFDLTNEEYKNNIQMDKDGPNGISLVLDFYIHNWDSIFIASRSKLSLINSKAEIVKKWDLRKHEKNGELLVPFYFNLQYNSPRKSFLYNIESHQQDNSGKSIMAEFFIDNDSLNELPIMFSDYYAQNKGNFGFLSSINKGYNWGDKIIYNFQFESNIYVYNYQTEQIVIKGGASKYTKNFADVMNKNDNDPDVWTKHVVINPQFFEILSDITNNLLYRFHFEDIRYKVANNVYNTIADKKLYLTIFNKNFEIVKEMEMPTNVFSVPSWFLANNNLYLFASHPNNKSINLNRMLLYKYQIYYE